MFEKYIIVDKELIPRAAKIISKEFIKAPLISYIIPNKDERAEVLPLMFESLLNMYRDIGVTYATTKNIEETFSLVDLSMHKGVSFYGSMIKSIPNMLKTMASVEFGETRRRYNHVKESLGDMMEFVRGMENAVFISSIASQNPLVEEGFLHDMLEEVRLYASLEKKNILVETETQHMVDIYMEHGFNIEKQCTIDEDVTVYLMVNYCNNI